MTKLEEELTGKVDKLMMENESLKAQVNLLLNKIYGRSREKGSYVDENQLALFNDEDLNIFNEPEIASDPNSEEPEMVEAIKKKKKRKSKHDNINNTVPIKEVECFLEGEDCQCEWCNSELRPIGREEVRREIEYIPATLQVKVYIRHAYECPTCKADGEDVIVKSKTPKPVIPKSVASPSAVAWLLHQKYEQYMPFNRQKSEWKRAGIELSRTTMANWAIKVSKDYLAPLYESLRKELLKNHILFADETTVQVLREKDRKPTSKSYMWLYRTRDYIDREIVLYDYQATRGSIHPKTFLADFKGFLHSDGYDAYNDLPNITRVGCLAHLRRKFHEAIPKGDAPVTASKAKEGRNYCDKLFHLEKKWHSLSTEERYKKRQTKLRPVFEEFFTWVEGIHVLPNSLLGKAITYAKNQKEYLMNVLLDGDLHLSNNLAERSIRPLVMGRKAWYFSTSTDGALSSAITYSIIQTAKANGLDAFKYLTYLFEQMPNTENFTDESVIKTFYPWNPDVQAKCQ